MRRKRPKLPVSGLALVERLITRERATVPILLKDFPGTAKTSIVRNLDLLRQIGLVRRHKAYKTTSRGNRVHFYWYRPTPRGREIMINLIPYREWWGLLETRELRFLAGAEAVLERLDGFFKEWYPEERRKSPRRSYWRRAPI